MKALRFKKRPQSKPDAAVKGSAENLEIHVEALAVTVETKSIVVVDIGIFIKGSRNAHK